MSTSPRFCPQCGKPSAPYETTCSNCGRALSEPSSIPPTQYAGPSSSIPPTQYAGPSSSIPPTQYASPPATEPYGSSPYGSPSFTAADPYGSSSPTASNPYGASPYEAATASSAPPPPVGTPLSIQPQKKSRRGLWIALGSIGVLVVIGIVLVFVFVVNTSTPTRTLQAFCTAIKGHDAHTAYEQLSSAAQRQISETQLTQNIIAFTDCTVSNANDAANSGTLMYTVTGGLKLTEDDTLVNENGIWKINSQQLHSTPTLTLITYCEAIKRGDFQTAFNQFSQNYQSQQSEQQFANSFSSPIANCTVSNVNDSAGTGRVTYTYSGNSQGTQFGDETLVNENGTWKINSEKLSS